MRTQPLGSMRKPFPIILTSSTARRVRVHDVEVGQCEHAEDGRLYAILKDGDSTREEPVGLFPFADVQVGPNCEFGRRITAVDIHTARPYSEDEADWLL